MNEKTSIFREFAIGVVRCICNGHHGPYLVASLQDIDYKFHSGSCTVNLEHWKDERRPKPGEFIYLSDFAFTKKGLRAHFARPVTLKEIRRYHLHCLLD